MRCFDHVTSAEMRLLLREAYSKDPEKNFLGQIARYIRDPARSDGLRRNFRPHPFWLTLALTVTFVASVFLYFTLHP